MIRACQANAITACVGRPVSRRYATEAKLPAQTRGGLPARPTKFKKPPLSLDHFLERQKAIKLWRDIVRAVNKIRMDETRDEMRSFARVEFERHRNETDLLQIKYLISTGRDQFKQMSRYVDEMGRR